MCMCVYTEKTNNSAAAKQPENVSVNMVNREQKDSLLDRDLPVKESLVNGGLPVKGAYCSLLCLCARHMQKQYIAVVRNHFMGNNSRKVRSSLGLWV